jgi:hypothetical protein
MKEKLSPHIIAVMALVVFIVLGLACASSPPYGGPDAEVKYVEYNIRNNRNYFAGGDEENPSDYRAGMGFKAITFLRIIDNEFQIDTGGGNYISFNIETVNELYPSFEVRFNTSQPKPSIVYISVHPKDPANPEKDLYFRLDRIEGLLSLERANNIVAREEAAKMKREKEEAERTAQEEARRLAREEANRYDPAKFIIVPSNFRPADYTKADLFAAVAASEKLEVRAFGWGYTVYTPSREFVSDVVFVSQNGTDITFRTDDNAIRKSMKVGSRTGLTAGQKVRIYYIAFNMDDWRVHAIEKL